uniref:Uncharacterized protein AlNc14C90G5657 n=1 Tax=Albugo laibachii Nc14 TaxID=890382 RepID=F0WGC6_9STRA|nr:conserved hypothetical protein [Albugo laibachii Nc14]|eukprot:CCA20286.1 conserved hypothetical protein [Albugo laibachii Nc14]
MEFSPQCMGISDSQLQQYEEIFRILISDAIDELSIHEREGRGAQYSSRTKWENVGQTAFLRSVRQSDLNRPGVNRCRLFGKVRCDCQRMMDFFYTDTCDSFHQLQQILQYRVHDARVLTTIKSHKQEQSIDPMYFGVKYICSQPLSSLSSRKQCYLEYVGCTRDSQNRRIGYVAVIPFCARSLPSRILPSNIQKMRCRNVYLFRENYVGSRQVCDIFGVGSFDLAYTRKESIAYFRKSLNLFQNISILIECKQLSQLLVLEKKLWVPNKRRQNCVVCQRAFGPTRHRHHCRLCGEVVCRKCLLDRVLPSKQKQASMVKLKFCKLCMTRVRLCPSTQDSNPTLANASRSKIDYPAYSSSAALEASRDSLAFASRRSVLRRSSEAQEPVNIERRSRPNSNARRFSNVVTGTVYEDEESVGVTPYMYHMSSIHSLNAMFSDSASDSDGYSSRASSISSISSEDSYMADIHVIDTNDMKRVPFSESRKSYYGASTNAFESISQSLQEQQAILKQMVLCASRR